MFLFQKGKLVGFQFHLSLAMLFYMTAIRCNYTCQVKRKIKSNYYVWRRILTESLSHLIVHDIYMWHCTIAFSSRTSSNVKCRTAQVLIDFLLETTTKERLKKKKEESVFDLFFSFIPENYIGIHKTVVINIYHLKVKVF